MFTSERGFLVLFFGTWLFFSFFFFFFCSGFLFSHFLHLPFSCAVHWDILYSDFFYYCTSPIMMENSSSKIQYFCLQCFLSNREGREMNVFLESARPVSILSSQLISLRSSVDLSLMPSFFDGYQRITGLFDCKSQFRNSKPTRQ